jgi:mannose-1-phosphate guanylyltransferase
MLGWAHVGLPASLPLVDRATEAIILVGGMGTRLRPLTVTTPKPMLPLAGAPCIEHQLAVLRAAGIEHVVLATSYRAETFTATLGDGSALGLRVDYATEEIPLGTGGAIRHAAALLDARVETEPDAPIVVLNGDILSGHDIRTQVTLHVQRHADLTLHLTEVADARSFGCVPTDDNGRVIAFLEKMPQPVTNRVNAGCYVFRRGLIEEIPQEGPVSLERDFFPGLLARRAMVLGYIEVAYWLDLGTPEAFVAGSKDLVTGKLPSLALPGPPGRHLLLPGAKVDPAATVTGGATLGRDVVVDAGALVDGAVIMDGAQVGADALVRESIIGTGAVIGEGSIVDGAVVGDHAQVGAGNELRGGIRVWCDAVLGEHTIRFSPG